MNALVDQALGLWGWHGATYTLIAARENAVFRVETPDGPRALRLHRVGYRTDAELWSELAWMEAIALGGLSVPSPVRSPSGDVTLKVNGTQISVLSWMGGETIEIEIDAMDASARASLYHQVGGQMARLHQISDDWTMPKVFTRAAWDSDGLLGEPPLWDRFWDNPSLTPTDRALFLEFRDSATAHLGDLTHTDYGLIHADLVPANVMRDGDKLHLIDFDDGGFGYRLFDMATALVKVSTRADYPALRGAMIQGYHTHRPLDTDALDLFMALRAVTYVGWIITRISEDGAPARQSRLISDARRLVRNYLSTA